MPKPTDIKKLYLDESQTSILTDVIIPICRKAIEKYLSRII